MKPCSKAQHINGVHLCNTTEVGIKEPSTISQCLGYNIIEDKFISGVQLQHKCLRWHLEEQQALISAGLASFRFAPIFVQEQRMASNSDIFQSQRLRAHFLVPWRRSFGVKNIQILAVSKIVVSRLWQKLLYPHFFRPFGENVGKLLGKVEQPKVWLFKATSKVARKCVWPCNVPASAVYHACWVAGASYKKESCSVPLLGNTKWASGPFQLLVSCDDTQILYDCAAVVLQQKAVHKNDTAFCTGSLVQRAFVHGKRHWKHSTPLPKLTDTQTEHDPFVHGVPATAKIDLKNQTVGKLFSQYPGKMGAWENGKVMPFLTLICWGELIFKRRLWNIGKPVRGQGLQHRGQYSHRALSLSVRAT